MDIVFDRRGDGPPLVLLHGIGHRRQGWAPVMDLLAAERDVIAVDLPGFGDSPALPAGTPYTLDTAIGALAQTFADLGLDRPHIAGNSLGGLFALEAADRGLASSATVLSPAGFFNALELRYGMSVLRASRLGARVPETFLTRLARSPRRRTLMFGMIYGRPDLMDVETLTGDARAMRDAPGFEPTLRAGRTTRFLGSCADVPVTIAWGTKDRLLLRSQAIRAQRRLPNARFVWLEGCGHVPMADDPPLVAQTLLQGSAHPLKTRSAA
ncbi:alpha/beta fold hydrolase [Actinomadura sp. NAK00032]|uniref:alpha/beta fold hydrolase n=1 Tax=Actinomadura sp. NAK00032 TaxID=2742128 RepID=UPI0015925C0D|nr:alpha/beta fold hydrolase [Actinomadura sp. NAK00032]QKW39790.1 alpha/beta fold hydrolase [Actinomadura sp. NAK00032]